MPSAFCCRMCPKRPLKREREPTAQAVVGTVPLEEGRMWTPRSSLVHTQARRSRTTHTNIAHVLAGSGELVDTKGSEGGRLLWGLTDTGEKYIRELVGLPAADPEIESDVGSLTDLSAKLPDATVRGFVDEAIKCLQVGALRAAVVFLWSGAIYTLHEKALSANNKQLNDAIRKHYPKAPKVSKIEDFAYIKDRTFLDATVDSGLFDKGVRDTLADCLDLRNRFGHPSKAKLGPKKVSSFIEDILSHVTHSPAPKAPPAVKDGCGAVIPTRARAGGSPRPRR